MVPADVGENFISNISNIHGILDVVYRRSRLEMAMNSWLCWLGGFNPSESCDLPTGIGLALCEGLGFAGVLQPDPPQLSQKIVKTAHVSFRNFRNFRNFNRFFCYHHYNHHQSPCFLHVFSKKSPSLTLDSTSSHVIPWVQETSPGPWRPSPAAPCWAPRRRRHAARRPGDVQRETKGNHGTSDFSHWRSIWSI